MDSIKALLFDLGNVILKISFQQALATWAQHAGIDASVLATRFSADEPYKQHERGEISSEAYFASLRESLKIDLSDEHLREGWNAIFLGEFTQTVALIKQMHGNMPLYIFSNINPTHKAFALEHYPDTLALFEKVFCSSDIGMRKPEARAFAHVSSEMGFAANEILFFDDTEENVQAARDFGMNAVLVSSPEDVQTALAEFV